MGCEQSVPVNQNAHRSPQPRHQAVVRVQMPLDCTHRLTSDWNGAQEANVGQVNVAGDGNGAASLAGVHLRLRERIPIVFLSLDNSASMSCVYNHQSLMAAAASGACHVLESLPDSSFVKVTAFGERWFELYSQPMVPLNPNNRRVIQNAMRQISPHGGTALYDTVIAMSLVILKVIEGLSEGNASLLNQASFWFVLLTDGEDTTSSCSLQDAQMYLRLLNEQLGGILNFVFIGVRLGSTAMRNLQALSNAGGQSSRFYHAQEIGRIGEIFQKITAEILAFRV